MKCTWLVVCVLLAGVATAQQGGIPSAVHYVNHEKISENLAKGGGRIVNDPGLTISANKREAGKGEVEYHDRVNHIFILIEGEATFVTGGTLVDPKRIASDQMTAAGIDGGKTHHLTKGSVITVPAKTPHWWKEVPKSAAYYVVNIIADGQASQPSGVPVAVHHIDNDTAMATMAKRGPIVNDPGMHVVANRRGAGAAELHELRNHIFIMIEGEATFITGGTLVEPKRASPEDLSGTRIDQGETHHLTKGDVITIPANTPHWWKEVPSKTVAVYAVNVWNY